MPPFHRRSNLLIVVACLVLLYLIQRSQVVTNSHATLFPSIHHNDDDATTTTEDFSERLEAIKAAFMTGFSGYEEHAWGFDELDPLRDIGVNTFGGWGATPVDALSTAIIMDMPDVVEKILKFVSAIRFDHIRGREYISLFESTIRFLGGLLSAYDLLTGPCSSVAPKDTDLVESLLTQATNLANNMSFAFKTPTGVPFGVLDTANQVPEYKDWNSLAGAGSLVLEWTRLSDITGNPKYAKLTAKAQSYFMDPKPSSMEPFPGLLGTEIDIDTGKLRNNRGGWGGRADSFYEYLLKMYVYDPDRFGLYKDRWILAADSTMTYLTSHPPLRPNLTFVSEFMGSRRLMRGEHLSCFHGGNFILGGLTLDSDEYLEYGLKLVEGCRYTYNTTATGIGPENYGWDNHPPAAKWKFYQEHGIYSNKDSYNLRPEVLESYYYAFIATGDPKYREWSWEATSAILNLTRVGSGYGPISNVNQIDGGGFNEKGTQMSFFFAEVLKYAFLIHSPDAMYQVQKGQQQAFVFNTEAHPLKVYSYKPKS